MSVSQAERIMALATERGPLGVTQHDFDYPVRDRGRPIAQVAKVIARACPDLEVVHTAEGPVWYLPAFAPAELMRSGWGCFACGARHPSDWPRDCCGKCDRVGYLVRVRVLRPEPQAERAAAEMQESVA